MNRQKMLLNMTFGCILLLKSIELQGANAVWVGNTDGYFSTDSNWYANTPPTSSTIAEFGPPGTAGTSIETSTGQDFSPLGIQFDPSATSTYYLYTDAGGNINIGLAGVVNNSPVRQTIATDASGAEQIVLAGGPSGDNIFYQLYNPAPPVGQRPGGLVFLTGTKGDCMVEMSDYFPYLSYSSLTNVSGDSSIGSLNGPATASVFLDSGSLTTGSLNLDDYFYGVISGPGTLILSTTTDNGSLGLFGANTYTGGTIINSVNGSYNGLSLYSGSSLASTGPVAVNSGNFNIYIPSQTIGSLSGTGTGIVLLGSGTAFTVNQTTNQTYAGIFTGSLGSSFTLGTLGSTSATATLQLTGDSSAFAGDVIVNSGNLQVNGNLGANSFTVNSGGILSGTGIFGTAGKTATIATGCILSPGNSVGVITNAGDQIFSTGSIYRLEENGYTTGPVTPSIDLLIVDGTATVDAGTIVELVTTNNNINFNTEQVFLTSQNPLIINGGGFVLDTSGLTTFNPEAFTATLSYDANNYYILTQTQFRSEVTNNGGDQPALAVATVLDGIVDPTTNQNFFLNELAQLSSSGLIEILDDMSGVQYASQAFLAEVSNRQFIRRLYDPLREIVTREPCDTYCFPSNYCGTFFGVDVWEEVGGGQRRVNGRSGVRLSDWHVTVGVQKTFREFWTFGLAGSYEHNELDHRSSYGSGCGYSAFGGLYGLYRPEKYYILADLAYGYTQHKNRRHIAFVDVTDPYVGRPNISQVTFYAEGGYDLNLCYFLTQPFVGIEVASLYRNSFSERDLNSTGFGLHVHKQNHTYATSSLGVHLTDQYFKNFDVSVDLAWLYRFTNHNHFDANFESIGTDFRVYGQRIGRSSGQGAITVSKNFWNNTTRVYLQGSGEIWSNASAYDILGGVQFTW